MNKLAALAGVACVATGVSAQQRPAFRTETRLVVLQVTVTNKSGQLVPDLDRASFAVSEEGRPQPITLFSRDDVPVSLGLLIDNSASMRPLRASVEAAALAFVRASHPKDDVFVLNFADTPRVDVASTGDVRVLEAGIARVDSIGGTALRDAVLMAERYLAAHAQQDRGAMLVITDGNDNASQASMSDLRKVVERTNAAIHCVRLADGSHPGAARKRDEELERVADLTGGGVHYVNAMGDVDAVVLDIARRIRSRYTIAYAPTNQALDGSYRAVRVKVTAPRGLTAHTRRGYVASPR
jgi:VWFA-related protein